MKSFFKTILHTLLLFVVMTASWVTGAFVKTTSKNADLIKQIDLKNTETAYADVVGGPGPGGCGSTTGATCGCGCCEGGTSGTSGPASSSPSPAPAPGPAPGPGPGPGPGPK